MATRYANIAQKVILLTTPLLIVLKAYDNLSTFMLVLELQSGSNMIPVASKPRFYLWAPTYQEHDVGCAWFCPSSTQLSASQETSFVP
jgi:hypothetical protein